MFELCASQPRSGASNSLTLSISLHTLNSILSGSSPATGEAGVVTGEEGVATAVVAVVTGEAGVVCGD